MKNEIMQHLAKLGYRPIEVVEKDISIKILLRCNLTCMMHLCESLRGYQISISSLIMPIKFIEIHESVYHDKASIKDELMHLS